jgi:hypothetical protein
VRGAATFSGVVTFAEGVAGGWAAGGCGACAMTKPIGVEHASSKAMVEDAAIFHMTIPTHVTDTTITLNGQKLRVWIRKCPKG